MLLSLYRLFLSGVTFQGGLSPERRSSSSVTWTLVLTGEPHPLHCLKGQVAQCGWGMKLVSLLLLCEVLRGADVWPRDVSGASRQCGPGAVRSLPGAAGSPQNLQVRDVVGGREGGAFLPLHSGPALQGSGHFRLEQEKKALSKTNPCRCRFMDCMTTGGIEPTGFSC